MDNRANALGTKGIICKSGVTNITIVNRIIFPLDLKLETNTIKLNLETPGTLKLHLKLREE